MFGFFLPIKKKMSYYYKIENNNFANYTIEFKNPFFSILNEECIARLFLDTIQHDSAEEASVYISKNFIKDIDLAEVKEFLRTSTEFKWLTKAEFSDKPKNCKTNSILLINEQCKNSIIHLHLVKEPDNFGVWKIYSIDKE